MTANQIAYATLKENSRHNQVVENETGRHNVATEFETYRHNSTEETETNRHNVVNEVETERSHRMNEALTAEWNSITREHYQNQDAIGWANVGIGYTNASTNAGMLSETIRNNTNRYLEERRSNTVAANETARHNKAMEDNSSYTAKTGRLDTWMDWYNNLYQNRISSKNAESNRMNAESNQLDAQTKAEVAKTTELANTARAAKDTSEALKNFANLFLN